MLVKDIRSGSSGSYPSLLDQRQRHAVLQRQRRHQRLRAVEERRHRGGHRAGQGHPSGSSGSTPSLLTASTARCSSAPPTARPATSCGRATGRRPAPLVKDIRSGSANSYPAYLTNVNGTLLFRATDGATGYELWKSDGTAAGTVLVKDIRSGSSNSYPRSLKVFNGQVYFRAFDDTHGYELWRSDGTSSGTVLLQDIWSGTTGSIPRTSHRPMASCSSVPTRA